MTQHGPTLGRLLDVDAAKLAAALSMFFAARPGSWIVSEPFVAGFSMEVIEKLTSALNLDLFELLGAVWAKAKCLEEYADPAKHRPDVEESVPLIQHKITDAEDIVLIIALASDEPVEFRLRLDLTVHFDGLKLTIQNAAITRVFIGEASVSLSLKYNGTIELIREGTPAIKLSDSFQLRNPIKLSPPKHR